MRSLLAFTEYRFLSELQFKINTLLVIFGSFVAAVVQYFLWNSVGSSTGENMEGITNYAVLAILFHLLMPMLQTATLISSKVVKGDIITWLIRPFDLLVISFFTQLGKTIFIFILQVIPLLLSYILIFQLDLENLVSSLPIFILSALLSFFIAFQFGYIIGVLSMFLINVRGIMTLLNGLMVILGGSVVPIAIYPEWLQVITTYMPFYYIMYLPLSLLTLEQPIRHPILAQLFWIVILSIIMVSVTRKVTKNMGINGG